MNIVLDKKVIDELLSKKLNEHTIRKQLSDYVLVQHQLQSKKSGQVEAVVSVNFEEETYKIIIAGNKLAEAAHKVQSDYDGIHRLRLALAEWYKVRANEYNRDNKISD